MSADSYLRIVLFVFFSSAIISKAQESDEFFRVLGDYRILFNEGTPRDRSRGVDVLKKLRKILDGEISFSKRDLSSIMEKGLLPVPDYFDTTVNLRLTALYFLLCDDLLSKLELDSRSHQLFLQAERAFDGAMKKAPEGAKGLPEVIEAVEVKDRVSS